jgi:hypothetical protein
MPSAILRLGRLTSATLSAMATTVLADGPLYGMGLGDAIMLRPMYVGKAEGKGAMQQRLSATDLFDHQSRGIRRLVCAW